MVLLCFSLAVVPSGSSIILDFCEGILDEVNIYISGLTGKQVALPNVSGGSHPTLKARIEQKIDLS